MQLFTYIQMPAMAIGGAVSAMAAQFIGAKKWDRLDHITRAGVTVNFLMTGLLTVILLIFDRAALVLFLGSSSKAVPLAQHIQWLAVWSFMLFGVSMVFSATMRAGGAVWIPLLIIAIALYPVRLGFYFLAYPSMGADAIWWSFTVGSIAGLILGWGFYRYSGWRRHAIPETSEEAQEEAQALAEPAGRMVPDV
jgi:Na+-driven multidrug efflux pump